MYYVVHTHERTFAHLFLILRYVGHMYYVWPDLLANIKSLKQYTNPEKHGNPPLYTAKPHGYRGIPQYQNKYPKQQQKQSAQSTLIIS